MTDNESPTQEPIVPSRTWKAASSRMLVEKDGPDYFVETFKDDENTRHRVFSHGLGCECKDYEYRKPVGGCKHMRRVDMTTTESKIPPNEMLPEGVTVDAALILQRESVEKHGESILTEDDAPMILADGGYDMGTCAECGESKPKDQIKMETHRHKEERPKVTHRPDGSIDHVRNERPRPKSDYAVQIPVCEDCSGTVVPDTNEVRADGGVAIDQSTEDTIDTDYGYEPIDLGRDAEMRLYVHSVVCEMTSDVALLPDFDENGAPFSQCVREAHGTIERLIEPELTEDTQ